ncbi:hypothetical protein [Roseimaritima ulvae]|uniref:3-keto-disaccharide hydrolase domain-containing protein n=1 Tax=Roseimaritima ulvae TaxID=980254 RepID=A0A5B9QJG6_9BACT|nr:hypothetical protein [Roseimaritima ulvae]QEG39267.1 hypothetical protein UC8_12280 [Roseimaritima ulvae]
MTRLRLANIFGTLALITGAMACSLEAQDAGKLIFSDDFERVESQETQDEVGNGWGTNSKARAGGNKQVDLKAGAMHITMHPTADHAVSVRHAAEFTDGAVELRFMLPQPQDVLGLDFADLKYKQVHAGHLFKVTIGTKKLSIDDMKSGGMNMDYYAAKKAKTLTPEQKKWIASKKKAFPVDLEAGKWHDLRVQIEGDKVGVIIDGEQLGAFRSEGFAHPTKRMLRLAVPRSAVVDDVKIYSQPSQ